MQPDPAAGKRVASPLSNFAALGPSEILGRAAGFYATALLARKLGVDAFGYLGFAVALTSYFGVALTVGFADIGVREVARDTTRARQLAADASGVRLLIAAAGMAITAVIAFTFIRYSPQRDVLLLSSLGLIATALDTTWVYRGLSRNTTSALTLLLAQLVYLGGVYLFVNSPAHVFRVPVIQFAGDMIAALILIGLLFRTGIPRPSIPGGIALVRESGYITLSRLLRSLIVTFDVLLLGVMIGSHAVGLYTAAYRVCMLVTTIAMATHIVFLPQMTLSASEGSDAVSMGMSRSLSLTAAVILPIVAGGVVIARPLLVLFFGGEYAAATTAFQLLLVSIAILSIHGIGHNVFVAQRRTRLEMLIFGGGAVLNIVLNLLLIPRYQLTGAAAATLAAELAILVASVIALGRLGLAAESSRLLLPLIASGVMCAVLMIFAALPVLLLVLIGGLSYVAVFAAAGGVRRLITESGLTFPASGD